MGKSVGGSQILQRTLLEEFEILNSESLVLVLVPYQRNKLLPRFVVMEEFAGEGAGGSAGVLFAHTAHLHAQVMTLEYYSYTQRR